MPEMKLPEARELKLKIIMTMAKLKCIPAMQCKGFVCIGLHKAFRLNSRIRAGELRIMSSGADEAVKGEMPGHWDILSFFYNKKRISRNYAE
jgi:hypothetical protein